MKFGADVELTLAELNAVVDQIALATVRTARSTVLRDLLDFSTAVTDASGQVLAQNVGILLHLAAVPGALAAVLGRIDRFHEGDVVILNDPYAGGTHLPDVITVVPAFHAGELIGFACVVAHHLDMGGHWPGSRATGCREIFQEGFRFGPTMLYRSGVLNEDFLGLLRANVRAPEEVVGDLVSQVTACTQATRNLSALAARHGNERLRLKWASLIDYTEAATRLAIRELPNREAQFVDHLDDDGVHSEPVAIAVRLKVADGRIHVDLEGSSAQVESGVNTNLAGALSGVYYAIRAALQRDLPENAGFARCISVTAPAASVVNASFPAPTAARGVTIHRIGDATLGALAQIAPDRVWAAGEGGPSGANFGGWSGDRAFIIADVIGGGSGGRPGADGLEGAFCPTGNAQNIPIEVLEHECPLRVRRYGFERDTGGAGKFRGANGLVKEYEVLCARAQLYIRSDRQRFAPWGLQGGLPGAAGENRLVRADGEQVPLPSKVAREVRQGDVVIHRQAGGGGYGPACERNASLIERDLAEDRVSPAWVEQHYGPRRGALTSSPNRG